MPVTKPNRRTLRDLRTLSGRADEASRPHRVYMKLAWLEMEKARRGIERNSVVCRLRKIDARLQEIEIEADAVRRTMAGGADGPASAAPEGRTAPGPVRRKRRQFKVRY